MKNPTQYREIWVVYLGDIEFISKERYRGCLYERNRWGERNRIGMIIGLMISGALVVLEIAALMQGESMLPRTVALVAGVIAIIAQVIGFKKPVSLTDGVEKVADSVADVLGANSEITDSIANLSATSQEVAASSETALSLSDSNMDAMRDMNTYLQKISDIAEAMKSIS